MLLVKEKNLEEERIKLARFLNAYNKEKEILDNIIQNFKKIQKQADDYITGGDFSVDTITILKSYALKLSQDIEKQKQTVQDFLNQYLNQQKIANQAYIEVKTLEKLKEKQKENYNKELIQEEFKLTDDLITSRFKNSTN